jgi:hypothetical protein
MSFRRLFLRILHKNCQQQEEGKREKEVGTSQEKKSMVENSTCGRFLSTKESGEIGFSNESERATAI